VTSATAQPLGQILLQARLITAPQLEQALALQQRDRLRLGEALVRLGFATEDDVAWALSTQLGLPYVHLRPDMVDPAALGCLPVDVARRLGVLPLLVTEGELAVAVADPTDRQVLDEVQRLSGLRPSPVVALASNIREVLEQATSSLPPAPAGDLALRLALSNLALRGASHVYVEPGPGRTVRVRYRTPSGVFPAEGPPVPWEFLAEVGRAALPHAALNVEVVLPDRSVEAALRVVHTRWGAGLAGPLIPLPSDPSRDDAGLPAEVWGQVASVLESGGTVLLASPDAGLRLRLVRSAAARLASRWGGVVVLAGPAATRPVPGVVEVPAAEALSWQALRPDTLVAEVPRDHVPGLVASRWPGQRLVLALPGYRALHARSALWDPHGAALAPLRGALAAVALPALCGCAEKHHSPYLRWPVPQSPQSWASPVGCELCRYTGYAGEAVAYEWEPAEGQGATLESTARALAESGRVPPQLLVRLLEG